MPMEMPQVGKRRAVREIFVGLREGPERPGRVTFKQLSRMTIAEMIAKNVDRRTIKQIADIRAKVIHGESIANLLLEYDATILVSAGLSHDKVSQANLPLERQRAITRLKALIIQRKSPKIADLLQDYTPWELISAGFPRAEVRAEYQKILKGRGSLRSIVGREGPIVAISKGYPHRQVFEIARELRSRSRN